MQLYQKESTGALLNPYLTAHKLWRNRALLRQFTWRTIEMRHKGSLLGMVWAVLSPLLVLSIYSFVFVTVFDGRFGSNPDETAWDYTIAIFLGLALMQLFLETLTSSSGVIVGNANYVKKVVFPLEILPISVVGASLFHCSVSIGLVLIAVLTFGGGLSWTVLWLPFIIVPILLIACGVAWLLSALGVFLRDLTFVTQFMSLLFMFLSAVFYPASRIPEEFAFLHANPMLVALEASRNAVLWHSPPSLGTMLYLYTVGGTVCIGGYFVFTKLRSAFADVI